LFHTDEYDLPVDGFRIVIGAVLRGGGLPVELWVVLHVDELKPLLKSWISLIAGQLEAAPTILFSLKNCVCTVGKVKCVGSAGDGVSISIV